MLARRQELRSSWPLDVRLDELQADLAASWSVRLASPMSPHHETVGVVPPGLVGVGVALDEAAEIDQLNRCPATGGFAPSYSRLVRCVFASSQVSAPASSARWIREEKRMTVPYEGGALLVDHLVDSPVRGSPGVPAE